MAITKAKKKRVSKKLKSSWRKHVDIEDVVDFLEEQRLDERLGPSLSGVSNDELFKVDIQPSIELLSAKERKKLRAAKPLKCFSALQPHTKVPDPIAKRNRVRTKEERKNDLIRKKEENNLLKGILRQKQIQAKVNRELDEQRRKNKPKKGEFNVDIWENEKPFEIEQNEWITTDAKKHNLRGVGIPVKNTRVTVSKKTSVLPAVEPPHPGMSYNPSFEDHQALLRIVAEKEQKLIKEEEHLTRCTTGMFQKVKPDEKDQSWLVEMSQGLPSTTGTNVEENEASGDEYKAINPPVVNKKKTLKQRRKQKQQRELEKALQARKLEKKKVTDIHQVTSVMKDIQKKQKKLELMRQRRAKRAEQKKNKTKHLGAMKFEEPDLEFNMGQEIAGNLKDLKIEGNLLADRFKSMQKRNILVPTKRHVRKKPKMKKYTKPGHKDEDWKKTVAR